MEIYELKNKILEVWAAARVIVQKYGHTKKFAKHIVAFVIKQCENFKDVKLVEFLGKDPMGKMLGYKKKPDETTFSKVRERMNPQIMEDLQLWIATGLFKGKQIRLIAQDSTDVPAYSEKDIGVELITAKGAVDELRAAKRKERWRNTVSFYKSKKNWVAVLQYLFMLGIFIAILIAPALGYLLKSITGAEIVAMSLWGAAFLGVLIFYLPLALVRWNLSIRKHSSGDQGVELGMSYKHYIQLKHEVEKEDIMLRGSSSEAVLVGENQDYTLDYANEPNPHMIVVGGSGSGKTVTTKAFITRASLKYGLHLLIIDWNGEYESYADSIGATTWHVPKELKINPFALRGASIADRASSIIDLMVFGARLTSLQANTVRSEVLDFYANFKEPTLQEIDDVILEMRSDRSASDLLRAQCDLIDQRFRSVQRVIGKEPEEFYKRMTASNNVINLAGLNDYEKGLVSYSILQRIYEEFNKKPELNKEVKLIVVLDEAWQILQSRIGDETMESLPSKIVRLGRKYGFGMLISTQQIEDVPNTFINSSSIRVIHSYHGSSVFGSTSDIFGFGEFETAYLKTSERGEALILDKGRAMRGQLWPDYVKVDMLTKQELDAMLEKSDKFKPEPINEPELPLDMGEEKPKQKTDAVEFFKPPDDRPTATVHAALLAIMANEGGEIKALAKYLEDKGFVKSPSTIYGNKGRKGVFETAVTLGLAKLEDNKYSLTDKGKKFVEPEKILETESEMGGEMHKKMLVKTIEYLHESNMFVMATSEPESFDLLGYPVDVKREYLWDDKARMAYEIQTTAREDSVRANMDKKEKYKTPITWVTYDEKILEEIKKITENKDKYLLIKVQ